MGTRARLPKYKSQLPLEKSNGPLPPKKEKPNAPKITENTAAVKVGCINFLQ